MVLLAVMAIIALILGVGLFANEFVDAIILKPNKGVSSFSTLFFLCPLKTQALYSFLLFKIFISALIISLNLLFSFSNHFIISIDIISLFSALILIFYHNLKIANLFPTK